MDTWTTWTLPRLKDLKTSEEKLPYMLPIAGVETLSGRMKASALEVGQSHCHLAAAGQRCHLGRRYYR